jgi:Fe-S cluster assembly scaffold protein SufB
VIFCSFSEAVQKHPALVEKYLGTVVPYTDNYFATLNSAVFTDGSFVFVPKGVRCPMELSTYFRINAAKTGQFERTLIVAEEGAYVSYLEGCTAPMRDENQLHAAVVELVALENAQIKYSTVQNWYPGDENGKAASTTSSPSAASVAARTRASAGRRSRPARRSPGSIRAASSRATTRSASSTRSRSRTTTSRRTPARR